MQLPKRIVLPPVAPLPPLNFTCPTPLLAAPPVALVLLFAATLLPPLAITVAALPNQESPPAEVLVLPAPTVTV